MTWKRRIGWAAIALGLLLVIVVVGGYAYVKSSSFNRFARRKIAEEVYQSTGAKATIGGLDFSLSGLTANLHDITLRGTEAADQPALLHATSLPLRSRLCRSYMGSSPSVNC